MNKKKNFNCLVCLSHKYTQLIRKMGRDNHDFLSHEKYKQILMSSDEEEQGRCTY
jgi:hypothetical protein